MGFFPDLGYYLVQCPVYATNPGTVVQVSPVPTPQASPMILPVAAPTQVPVPIQVPVPTQVPAPFVGSNYSSPVVGANPPTSENLPPFCLPSRSASPAPQVVNVLPENLTYESFFQNGGQPDISQCQMLCELPIIKHQETVQSLNNRYAEDIANALR